MEIDLPGEICTCATWAKPFLPNAYPHSWFMPTTAQLENVYYYAGISQNDATTN